MYCQKYILSTTFLLTNSVKVRKLTTIMLFKVI